MIINDITTNTRAELASAAQSKSATEGLATTASQTAKNPDKGMGTAGDTESDGKQNSNSTKMKRVPETTTAATGSSPHVVSALIWAEDLALIATRFAAATACAVIVGF